MNLEDLPKTLSVMRLVSPKYIQKFVNQDAKESGTETKFTSHYEPAPENDLINEWLKANSVSTHLEPFPQKRHYQINGSNGVVCDIAVEEKQESGGEFFHPQDRVYRREVEIRYQPNDRGLPEEVTKVLNTLGFLLR